MLENQDDLLKEIIPMYDFIDTCPFPKKRIFLRQHLNDAENKIRRWTIQDKIYMMTMMPALRIALGPINNV